MDKRGCDINFYPCSEYFYRGADEEGDGYLSNNFTHYSKGDPQTEFSVVFLDNQRDAAVEAIAATWEASWRKSLKLGDGTYVAWVTVAKNDAKRFTETLDDDANVISYEEIG